jgi:tRNA(Ile2) C34 agmatinyltransferase TiaS
MGAKGQSDWELSFLNKLRLRVLLFFGRCPDCGGKLWTWSYGKYKCDRCQETFPA